MKEKDELPQSVSFMAQGSVRNVPTLSKELSQAGFRLLGLGVESFSTKVLKEFNKKQTLPEIHDAITALLEVGVTPYVNLILSSPDSTVDDLITTVSEALRYLDKGASIALSLYTLAFPGSDWMHELMNTGLITYKKHPIIGTSNHITLADKILPNDPLLKEVLGRSEDEFNQMIKHPLPNKTRIRSYVGCVALYCILKVLKEMEIIEENEKLDQARQNLLVEQSCSEI
jgi:hypothetical protein